MGRNIYTYLSLLLLLSCSKPVNNIDYPKIIGDWQWYKTKNAFTPVETPLSTGKSWLLSLHEDSVFIHTGDYYTCTVPAATGSFHIQGNKFNLSANGVSRPYTYFLNITEDSLTLDAGSGTDAPIYYLVRKY